MFEWVCKLRYHIGQVWYWFDLSKTFDTELYNAEKYKLSHILEANLNNDLHKMKEYLDYNRLNLNMQKLYTHSTMLIHTLTLHRADPHTHTTLG